MGRYMFTYRDEKGRIVLFATSTREEDDLDLGVDGLVAIGFTGKGCKAFIQRCEKKIAPRRDASHAATITDTLYGEEKML